MNDTRWTADFVPLFLLITILLCILFCVLSCSMDIRYNNSNIVNPYSQVMCIYLCVAKSSALVDPIVR